MARIIYTPEQKAEIIKKAKEIGTTSVASYFTPQSFP